MKLNPGLAKVYFQVVEANPKTHEQAVKVEMLVDHNTVPGYKDAFLWAPKEAADGSVSWSGKTSLQYDPQHISIPNPADLFTVTLGTAELGDLSVLATKGLAFGVTPDNGPERDLQTLDDNTTLDVANHSFVAASGPSTVKSYPNYSFSNLSWLQRTDLQVPNVGALQLNATDMMTSLKDGTNVEVVAFSMLGENGKASALEKLKNPELVLLDSAGNEQGTLPLNFETRNPAPEYIGSGEYTMAPGAGSLTTIIDAQALRTFSNGQDLHVKLRATDSVGAVVTPATVLTIPAASFSKPVTGGNILFKG